MTNGRFWSSRDVKTVFYRCMLWILLIFTLPLLLGWFVLARPVFPVDRAGVDADIDPQRLEQQVRLLCERMAPRNCGNPENLDRTATYIHDLFQTAHARDVAYQPFTPDTFNNPNNNEYRNVRAFFGPKTPKRLVVGAHYDTVSDSVGADDNTSAVVGLLELARMLGQHDDLTLEVELVAFCLEEPPYFDTPWMGSAVHARSLVEQGTEIELMMCLEMIGYYSDHAMTQQLPLPFLYCYYPHRGNFLAVIGRLSDREPCKVKKAMRGCGLPVYSLNAPTILPGIDLSDHRNYWAAGYPAVMITDTAFYRNTFYHTVDDTPDILDYERMALAVKCIYAAVLRIAGAR